MAKGQVSGENLVNQSVFDAFDRLDKRIAASITNVNGLQSAARSALGGSGLGEAAGKATDETKKATSALSEYEKALREVARQRERNQTIGANDVQQLAQERVIRSQVNKFAKDEAVLTSNLTQAYARLRKQRDLSANTLRNLIASQSASNKQIRNATVEFKRLDGQVRTADRAVGNFRDNVGNYGSAVRGVLGVTRSLLGAFGLFSGIQIAQRLFEQVKALDSVRFGLEQVTETQVGFNNATAFLSVVAERAGADLIGLTNRYTNFLAAAKSTTLTLAETQRVFENVVVAGAALGRSQDDINGSLRALEQILSKGNVQAEEIRGQLGERLPGAFQILEKALGLATGELNDMLEVGGLLSVDAIPALSRGLEEAFKLETIERVETLAAAQGRLNNEFTLFITQLEEGGGPLGTFAEGVLGFLTTAVKGFSLLARNQDQADEYFRDLTAEESYSDTLKALADEAERSGKAIVEVARDLQGDFTDQFNQATSSVESLNKELKENPSLLESITIKGQLDEAIAKVSLYEGGLKAVVKVLSDFVEESSKVGDAAEENANTLANLRVRLRNTKEAMEDAALTADDRATPAFLKLKKEANDLQTRIKALTGEFKENKEKLEEIIELGSVKFAQDLENELRKLQDRTEVGSAAWTHYQNQLDNVGEAFDEIKEKAALLRGDLSSLDLFDGAETDVLEGVRSTLSGVGLDALLADFAQRAGLSSQELTDEYIKQYGRDFDKFKEFQEKKIIELELSAERQQVIQRGSADIADELAQSVLQVQLERLEDEERKQKNIFDSVTKNKESSEEAIRLAGEDRRKSEERIEDKRQQAERNAFLFRQATAVADIFLAASVAKARAKAASLLLGPLLGDTFFATQLGIISANTATSLGVVLAQTLPAFFFKGKGLGDNYEGDAIWGELRREIKLGKDGALEVSPDGPAQTHVKSSDMILKSFGEFRRQLGSSNSETSKRVRRGVERTSQRSLGTVYSTPNNKKDPDLEKILERAVSRGMSRAKLSPKFNIYNDSKVRRV